MKRKVICYQLELGKELADVSTECSSCHQIDGGLGDGGLGDGTLEVLGCWT